jgi:hypothetical protein
MKKLVNGVLALLIAGSFACKKAEPPPTPPPATLPPPTTAPPVLAISTVTLGSAIGADKRVTTPTETFTTKDTVYATVETTGTGNAKVRALWTFVRGEKTAKVDETTIEVVTTAPTVNEFHVSKPSGWPKGDYRVEIFLGDAPTAAVTKTFKVG